MFGDRLLYVTAAELQDLGTRVRALVDEYFERQVRPDLRPAGARLVTWLNLAFPSEPLPGQSLPGQPLPGEPEAGAG